MNAPTTRTEELELKAVAINTMHLFMSKVVPELQELKPSLRFNSDGQANKKGKEAINLILSKWSMSRIRARIEYNQTVMTLQVDVNYPVCGCGCEYLYSYFCLDNEWWPQAMVMRGEDLANARLEVRDIEAQIRSLTQKKNNIMREYYMSAKDC